MQHFTQFTDYNSCVRFLTTELHKTAPRKLKDATSLMHSLAILDALSNPQNSIPTIHIAATSGKGSMAYAIDAILRSHSFTTTLMVSPHAYCINERIQQNGTMISDSNFMNNANEVLNVLHQHSIQPTYFEVLMSMGFMAAAKQQGNYVVIETGLGGLWDTSNTINRRDKIAVIGSIGLDHTHILGDTVEAIAAQKAGILPLNGYAIVLRQSKAINMIIEKTAKKRSTTLQWVESADNAYETNWKMAEACVQYISRRDNWAYDEDTANRAIQNLKIPARFEIRTIDNQTLVLDAAHNPQKVKALTHWLQIKFPGQKFATVLAISEGKDAANIIKGLNGVTDRYIITSFLTNQQDMPVHALDASTLTKIVKQNGSTIPITTYSDPVEALEDVRIDKSYPVLITGSFYLISELGALLPD